MSGSTSASVKEPRTQPFSDPDAQQDLLWNAPLAMAAIAHEIRNPLLAASANMELLHDQMDPHDPRRRCVDRALGEVDRLSGVVDRLVDFATTHQPELERLELVAFIRETVATEIETLRDGAHGDAHYHVDIVTDDVEPGADCAANVDPKLLARVVANLLRNAVESMSEGGRVAITIERSSASEMLIRVEDDGAGVPTGMGDRIFQPFVTTKANGTGLGLSFSRRIARVHGGELRAIERKGGGCFELTVPLAGRTETGDAAS